MMTLVALADQVDGILQGPDTEFDGVSIDSRTVTPGELFVAIRGERVDGHDFVAEAVRRGAAGILVSRRMEEQISQVAVVDTTRALGQLAASWRRQFDLPVIGVTGSNGKTTVTAMVRAILSVSGQPLAPKASYNNHWGVPLTLLALKADHTHAVIEMGMNHPGEIGYLAQITAPDVALINNAVAAHLEGLGTVERVAQAKGEILAGVDPDGTVVLNRDDPNFHYWQERADGRRILTFSLEAEASFRATELRLQATGSRCSVRSVVGNVALTLRVPGRHNIQNALAAMAVSHAAGGRLEDLSIGLERFAGMPGRLRPLRSMGGAALVDDSFNANPSSVQAAIDHLSGLSGRRILVLGAMAELGPAAKQWHAQVGEYARTEGIERLLVLDDSDNPAVQGYGEGFGADTERFAEVDTLAASLMTEDRPGNTILVKGSKSARMGRVVQALTGVGREEGASC